MADNKKSKVTPIRSYSWLNIGTIMFLAIFIYMIITVVIYMTAKHITTYEVTAGSISGDYRYTALALKDEQIIPADYSGYVTYYAREGARTGAMSAVCSVSASQKAESAAAAEPTAEDYSRMKSTMASFALNFQDNSFQGVYSLKADLETTLLETRQNDEAGAGTDNIETAPESGFVVYRVDGMEGLTDDDITSDLFNQNNYKAQNLHTSDPVKTGDSLYKLIKGEDWALYFPISDELAASLSDRSSIRFRFLKDDTTFTGSYSQFRNEEQWFGKLTLHNSLVRYVSDRFLEIELLLDSKTGLKVPSSAIDSQKFYQIPDDYVLMNKDSSSECTMVRESFGKDGSSKQDYITAKVYGQQDGNVLVSTELFKPGDYVLMPDTTKKHPITDDDLITIQGVYNINQGYAIFREVTVIDENEEFCIVDPSNPYGLAAHDFIVLDASTVDADEII